MPDLAPPSPTSARIASIVAGVLAKHKVTEPIAEMGDLADHGMTSIDMVELMLGVEAEFDVAIPPTEITPDNFRSVATIAALVSRLGADR